MSGTLARGTVSDAINCAACHAHASGPHACHILLHAFKRLYAFVPMGHLDHYAAACSLEVQGLNHPTRFLINLARGLLGEGML